MVENPVDDEFICTINDVNMTRDDVIKFIRSFDDNNNQHKTFWIGNSMFGYDDMGRHVVMDYCDIKEIELIVVDVDNNDS